jgi:hypothetical protein
MPSGSCQPVFEKRANRWEDLGIPKGSQKAGFPCWGKMDELTTVEMRWNDEALLLTAVAGGRSSDDGKECQIEANLTVQECSNCCCPNLIDYKTSFKLRGETAPMCESWYAIASNSMSTFFAAVFRREVIDRVNKRCSQANCNITMTPAATDPSNCSSFDEGFLAGLKSTNNITATRSLN